MSVEPQQLVLDLPHRAATGREDFLVSRSNQAAVDLIDADESWPNGAALVVGPAGSGKSHLAHVWQARTGAALISADAAHETALTEIAGTGGVVIEDIDDGIADPAALFHLINMARQGRLRLLLTSTVAAGALEIALPDLRSRIRAMPMAEIAPPDEALLNAVLVKLFADRQLDIAPGIVSYCVTRMERSMAAANALVAEVDRLGLAMRRKVTRPLVQSALQSLSGGSVAE